MPLGPCHPGDTTTPIARRLPNSAVAVPTVSSGLQRRVIMKLFKNAGAPLMNLFLTFMVKSVSCGAS